MQEFTGKVAVVTGAASGIGRALVEKFADQGMNIVLADIDEGGLQESEKIVQERGVDALCVVTDVTRQASVAELADRSFERFGSVHVLCNNAGVLTGGTCWELPVEDYQWLIGVNTFGVIHGVRSFVPRMIEQDTEGHIVNTASMAGLTTLPFAGAYHLSKHAALAFSECLYHELVQTGTRLRVSALCPELIDTGIHRSERCRPAQFENASGDAQISPAGQLVIDALADGMKNGLDPMVMANRVFDAIVEERFYILAEDTWRDACNTRLEDIRLGRDPTFAVPS